jgi:hypothetical protein
VKAYVCSLYLKLAERDYIILVFLGVFASRWYCFAVKSVKKPEPA